MTTKQIDNLTYFLNPSSKFERYNGGWTKTVIGIDKTKNNGYSILGDFLRKNGDHYKVGNLYLDCGIGGSRKNQEKYYNLFTITENGEIKILKKSSGKNWSIELWDEIEKKLNIEINHFDNFSDAEILAEVKKRNLI